MKNSMRKNLDKILKKNSNLTNKKYNKKWSKRNFKIWKENYLKQIKIDKNSVLESFKYFLIQEGFDGKDGELLYNKVEKLLDFYKLEE